MPPHISGPLGEAIEAARDLVRAGAAVGQQVQPRIERPLPGPVPTMSRPRREGSPCGRDPAHVA
jgi:hypothetical protein